ncbi:MAG TPA: hypothetical protein VGE45_03145 [Chloroflexia bacterium]|jgi:hypothetical protein
MTNNTMGDMHGGHMDGMHGGNMGHMHGETKGVHNWMMVGKETIYLSHLPMFMFNPQRHAHNFQVILEVTLSPQAHAIYKADRDKHPDVLMYTMEPLEFEIAELDPQRPKRRILTGKIYRGHLERGGEQIIPPDEDHPLVEAHVENIIYFREFDPNAQPLDELEYLLFGKGQELFLAHAITRPPDFDQILSVNITASGSSITDDDLRQAIRIGIGDRANTPQTRIKPGEPGERVTGHVLDRVNLMHHPRVDFEVGTEFYFEEGELGDPKLVQPPFDDGTQPPPKPGEQTFVPTPEEERSGF